MPGADTSRGCCAGPRGDERGIHIPNRAFPSRAVLLLAASGLAAGAIAPGLATGRPFVGDRTVGPARKAPPAAFPQDEVLDLDLGFRRGSFRIQRSDEPLAFGWSERRERRAERQERRQLRRDARLSRLIDDESALTITSRVIVRLSGPLPLPIANEMLRSLAPDGAVRAIPGRGRFFVVDLPTVARAAEVAKELEAIPNIARAHLDVAQPRRTRSLPIDDPIGNPLINDQWHLFNADAESDPVDLNLIPAWTAGFTGSGVDVGIVEAGWQYSHPDLAPNHNASLSMPNTIDGSHSTSVTGIIAAAAGNGLGGAGVAFDARVSGQIYGTASEDAAAILHQNGAIDVKNNSWGPLDTGAYWTLAPIQAEAMRDAAELGRGGLGTVLVWAAGNGGRSDRIEYDPWASSRFTIAVGAVGENGVRSNFSEVGSSLFCVAPSSGGGRSITTTTNQDGYTSSFGATSATAPQVSGVVALMLQANPQLSYRDVMHVIAQTARVTGPSQAWSLNAAGVPVSEDYGFGLIDASAAVFTAETWEPVGPLVEASSGRVEVGEIPPGGSSVLTSHTATIDEDLVIEHVELVFEANTSRPEDLTIILTSPGGTESVLARARLASRIARSDPDLDRYVLTSTNHWSESSRGTWTVSIADLLVDEPAEWLGFEVRVFGTAPQCNADFDASGTVDMGDLDAFVTAWFAGDASTDTTTTNTNPGTAGYRSPDGVVDGADLSAFVECWLDSQF